MDNKHLSDTLQTQFDLDIPPIAISFMDEIPEDIHEYVEEVPSSCTFWRKAAEGVFFARADKHANCPLGAMVMGFSLPERVQENLKGFVNKMCECKYIDPEEVGLIPKINEESKGVVYGPLSQIPSTPDAILIWLDPAKAMIFCEIVGNAKWTEQLVPTALGRPACAALPCPYQKLRTH